MEPLSGWEPVKTGFSDLELEVAGHAFPKCFLSASLQNLLRFPETCASGVPVDPPNSSASKARSNQPRGSARLLRATRPERCRKP